MEVVVLVVAAAAAAVVVVVCVWVFACPYLAAVDFVPRDGHLDQRDLVLDRQVEQLDVKRPALNVLDGEDTRGGGAAEHFEAALGVLDAVPANLCG